MTPLPDEPALLDLGAVEVDDFALFWASFPRKKDKKRAAIAYRRALHIATAEEILLAARAYAATVDGQPADRIRWAVEWLRAEPWKPEAPPMTSRPPARARRRRDPLKPRRAPHSTARVRLTVAESRAKWLREHGLTETEYEARKDDTAWLERIKRRGIVT